MCNSEWTHIHTHTESMRRYEIAVLGHLYNLKYTHKKTKAMYGTSTTPQKKNYIQKANMYQQLVMLKTLTA